MNNMELKLISFLIILLNSLFTMVITQHCAKEKESEVKEEQSSCPYHKEHAVDGSLKKTLESVEHLLTPAGSELNVEAMKQFEDILKEESSAKYNVDETNNKAVKSFHSVGELLDIESTMLDKLGQYIEEEKYKLETLKVNLQYWLEVSDHSMADIESYLSIYTNCYHLLKRLAYDLNDQILKYSLNDNNQLEELNLLDDIPKESMLLQLNPNQEGSDATSTLSEELLKALNVHELLTLINLLPPEKYDEKFHDILSVALKFSKPEFEFYTETDLVNLIVNQIKKLVDSGFQESAKSLIKSTLEVYPENPLSYNLSEFNTEAPSQAAAQALNQQI